VGDLVFLNVYPTSIVHFCATPKLSPSYIGPFYFIAQVDNLAYQLQLSECMKDVHNVFHISMLRKYL
jgi:hypothetical protein